MVMTVERLEARAKSRTAQEARKKRLPGVIDNAATKLEHLLSEAEWRGVPIGKTAGEKILALRSRYLTDPNLVAEAWEETVQQARKNNRA